MNPRLEGLLLGLSISGLVAFVSSWILKQKKAYKEEYDDDCHSLFYGFDIGSHGEGYPALNSLNPSSITSLTKIHDDFKYLPAALYKGAVENLPIVCVDVICQNISNKKILLFYRRDPPASSIWWWPGGRMFRGESFYAAAVRKLSEETGIDAKHIVPVGVINVWNTFFPDSCWDSGRALEKYGTQTVNITVVCRLDQPNFQFSISNEAKQKWAVESHKWIDVNDALKHGQYDKYVRLNVEQALMKEFL